jgi:hypothetical protein
MTGDLGAILRAGFAAVPARHHATVRALSRCRTGELGHTHHACPDCGHHEVVPRGCGNRHCPRCQGRLARAWLARQQAALLEVAYFHVVCTLPHELLPLCAAAPRELYALLFESVAQTLQQLGRERLGGELGLTTILHTWGQRLNLHPHLHCIVAGGALDEQGRWHAVKSRRFLLPVGVIAALFRGKFLAGLTRLKERGALPEPPGGWPKLWQRLGAAKPWVVYCKPPFAGPESVLAYMSNYTHRVAIAESRIEHFDRQADTVTYRYRDYRVKARAHAAGRPAAAGADPAIKHETLSTEEFVQRFCRHLLPRSFTKIRHYGFLANHARTRQLPRVREAIARTSRRRKAPPLAPPKPEWKPACPHCGGTRSVCIATVLPDGRVIALPAAARLVLWQPRAPP